MALHGKFAVIKQWPHLTTAEDECIARLVRTAHSLGLECFIVDPFARLIDPPHTQLNRDDVDFVISLHYETPKRYDIFSFVALWNPLRFYHEWGYRRNTNHLLTHDDFLSCDSTWADDHVRRCIHADPTRVKPYFRVFHSLSEPLLEPDLGDGKLFYAGINWELVGKKPGRHQALLKMLDETGDLRIFGPQLFHGVRVWAGYRSYAGEIPFDGISIVKEIHRAGIALVLSSEAHQESELMSSRLFESLAAGAVVLCSENSFVRRHFGETVLYFDASLPPSESFRQVRAHLDWIASLPDEALRLARRSQELFVTKFKLDVSLARLYRGFEERKATLEGLYTPRNTNSSVALVLLMPKFERAVLDRHIASCLAQRSVSLRIILAMSAEDTMQHGTMVRQEFEKKGMQASVASVAFSDRACEGRIARRRRRGQVLMDALALDVDAEFLMIAGPNESLFSDHLCSLLRALEDSPNCTVAWANMLWAHRDNGDDFADLCDELDLTGMGGARPLGIGRFLFRKNRIPADISSVLPYLDCLATQLLVGSMTPVRSWRCSITMRIQDEFCTDLYAGNFTEEADILTDYLPSLFRSSCTGFSPDRIAPVGLSLDRMPQPARAQLLAELVHSLPIPRFLEKLIFGTYRLWSQWSRR